MTGPRRRLIARLVRSSARPSRRTPPRCDHDKSMSSSATRPPAGSRESRNGRPDASRATRPPAILRRTRASVPPSSTATATATPTDRAVTDVPATASRFTGDAPSATAKVRSTMTFAPGAALPGVSELRSVRSAGSMPGRSTSARPLPRSAPAAMPTDTRDDNGTRSSVTPLAYGARPRPPSVPPAVVGGSPNRVMPASPDSAPSMPSSGRNSCGSGSCGGGVPPCTRDSGVTGRSRRRTLVAMCWSTPPIRTTSWAASKAGVPQP